MNCATLPTVRDAKPIGVCKFRRPDPGAPLEAPRAPHLRLAQLSAISGVDLVTIATWTKRGIWDRPAKGRHRRFTFWDCLHLAIIREMGSVGMQISGRGADLSDSLNECAKRHVAWQGDINDAPDRIALYALDSVTAWRMDWETPVALLPRSYVVLNLRSIVEDVNQRYHAPDVQGVKP